MSLPSKAFSAFRGPSKKSAGLSTRLRSVHKFFRSKRGRTLQAYLVSVATVAIATGLRLGLDPVLGEHHPFTLYFAAVAITAWYGGFLPAVLAIVLGYFAADWFFITPRFEFNWPRENLDEFMALMAFVFSGLAIAITSKIMREALARARQKQRELELEIAERHRAEQALKHAQAQLVEHAQLLEQHVQERTVHLQETIRSLQGVCYHIAHDLRAPLRAIEGFTDILMNEYAPTLDATGSSLLQRVNAAAQNMDLLIRGLLEYGRLGHEEFSLAPFDPKDSLERVLSTLSSEITSKNAEIKVAESWPALLGNQMLLELVFLNLLGNALKFVRPGIQPRVEVSAEQHESFIRFSVADNGIGIDPEHLHNAFKIFQHLHPRGLFPGIGIGLAITAKAIEIMGGRVGVESKLNFGSRFWFELRPVSQATARKANSQPEHAEALAFSS